MVKKGFDRIASLYDFLIFITSGKSLAKSRTHLLQGLAPVKSCLILGGGTGDSLLYILSENLAGKVVFIDASPQMVAIAKKKVAKELPEKYQTVDFRIGFHNKELQSEEVFDLVVTNYFLDVLHSDYIPDEINFIKRHLSDSGSWLCTDFYNSGYKLLRSVIFSIIITVLYRFFNIFCSLNVKKLPDIPNNMKKAGLFSIKSAYFYFGLLRSDIWKKTKN